VLKLTEDREIELLGATIIGVAHGNSGDDIVFINIEAQDEKGHRKFERIQPSTKQRLMVVKDSGKFPDRLHFKRR